MNRLSHRILGSACAATYSSVADLSMTRAATAMAVAALVAPLPDCDQRGWWKLIGKAVPNRLLDHGGPMRHRGITHWPGTAIMLIGSLLALDTLISYLPVVAISIGWCSHLLGDFLIGARSRYRGPGIPLAPWWHHRGAGAHNGGILDTAVTVSSGVVTVLILYSYLV
jgi:membrane-bound metal-dependent hydrolase YbcI (DUF457 family)